MLRRKHRIGTRLAPGCSASFLESALTCRIDHGCDFEGRCNWASMQVSPFKWSCVHAATSVQFVDLASLCNGGGEGYRLHGPCDPVRRRHRALGPHRIGRAPPLSDRLLRQRVRCPRLRALPLAPWGGALAHPPLRSPRLARGAWRPRHPAHLHGLQTDAVGEGGRARNVVAAVGHRARPGDPGRDHPRPPHRSPCPRLHGNARDRSSGSDRARPRHRVRPPSRR